MVCVMKPIAFDDLARLPVVKYYEAAFRKATGVSLKLMPPEASRPQRYFGLEDNAFCCLAASTSAGCAACLETETRAQRGAAKKLALQQLHCYAGMTVVAVPVMSGGRHVATVLSGQVFRREPTQRDFALVMKMLGGGVNADWEKKARKAYFEIPVVTADRFQAILQLLNVFVQYLADCASRQAIASSEAEP
jgi:ligand-binding sensor protein